MNGKVVGLLALGLIVAVWVVGAVATTQRPEAGAGPVELRLSEMSISPNRIDARVGRPVTLRVTNVSTNEHDLAFDSAHMEGLRGAQAILSPGETQTLILTFTTPGVHQFRCSIHGPAAMSGAVFVSA
jgi:plastocyanin